jgi:hypothetical protein
MKKFMMALVCLMTMVVFSSCSEKAYNVTANYDVCYPDGTRNYDCASVVCSYGKPSVACFSYGGTNYLTVSSAENIMKKDDKKVLKSISTTSPIRLNSWSVTECKKEKPRCIAIKKNGEKCNRIAEKDSEYCWKHEDTAHKPKKKSKYDEIYMSDILSH